MWFFTNKLHFEFLLNSVCISFSTEVVCSGSTCTVVFIAVFLSVRASNVVQCPPSSLVLIYPIFIIIEFNIGILNSNMTICSVYSLGYTRIVQYFSIL
jgi:hypothetical protein